MKQRLDEAMVERQLASSRSQAARLVKLGKVKVGARQATKPAMMIWPNNSIEVTAQQTYVSRAGFKLESAVKQLRASQLFKGATMLDIGSSTGGFTDYALQNGAARVLAVDVGTEQLHPSLRGDARISLHEKTDIREFEHPELAEVGLFVADVSFVSLREVLPPILKHLPIGAQGLIMVKPQFEAGEQQKNKGVVKNERMRRDILQSFEEWLRSKAVVLNKADSEVAGSKGNRERFFHIKL